MTGAEGVPLLRIRRGAQAGRSRCGGWLIVEPGAVRFEIAGVHRTAGRLLGHDAPAVVHAKGPLVLKRARLFPPGINTGLILQGDEGVVTVLTWGFMLGRLKAALAQAGVELIEQPTWISIGVAEAYDSPRPPN